MIIRIKISIGILNSIVITPLYHDINVHLHEGVNLLELPLPPVRPRGIVDKSKLQKSTEDEDDTGS